MSRPWVTLERVETDDGPLELRQRGDDFLILIAGRVLMNSAANRSELELARLACERLDGASPRVLIGGLGMGFTLRAALDALPATATVEVVELNPVTVAWCRGPLSAAIRAALDDPRVVVTEGDVARRIEAASRGGRAASLDAIVLDLYEGPHDDDDPRRDPFYGTGALERTRRALAPGGWLAVWSEDPSARFEKRLRGAGFEVERQRPGRGGRRHVVYLARKSGDRGAAG